MKHPDANVMIGTPAYGGMVHMNFTQTLLGYQRAGIAFSLVSIGNESLITRARNTLLALFHARPEFTHLLFLDADVELPATGLVKLLEHDRDVIGAPVALKGRDANGARIFNVGRAVGEDGVLSLHERIGTAALMLSRRAVDALITDAKNDGRVYSPPDSQRGEGGPTVHYDVFQVGVVDGDYLSEDFWVCRTLRRLGFDIHVDAEIVTQHFGTVAT
ncbi:MAG: hypothetical protein KDG50_08840 [Chromatiales bacterium]|nr:hypothetical protein [Chromatiales bacterium]